MRQTIASLTLLLLAATPLRAQLPPDSVFDHLIGQWVLRGTIAHQTTTHDVTFEWMLGREYAVWLEAVERLCIEAGLPRAVARARAEDFVVRVEGALVAT